MRSSKPNLRLLNPFLLSPVLFEEIFIFFRDFQIFHPKISYFCHFLMRFLALLKPNFPIKIHTAGSSVHNNSRLVCSTRCRAAMEKLKTVFEAGPITYLVLYWPRQMRHTCRQVTVLNNRYELWLQIGWGLQSHQSLPCFQANVFRTKNLWCARAPTERYSLGDLVT